MRFVKPLLGASVAVAPVVMLALSPSSQALAACTPAAGDDVTATCTGTTTDQNTPNGYGTGVEENLNVTVVPGAHVAGTNEGVSFNSGSVTNSGLVNGGADGVFAAIFANSSVTIDNSGTIRGGFNGILGNSNFIVNNSGVISAAAIGGNGIATAGTVYVTNSGKITGTGPGSTGIFAASNAHVTNSTSGTISGDFGVSAGTATVTNSGTISGDTFGITGNLVNVTNYGLISGGGVGNALEGTTAHILNYGTISGGVAEAIEFSTATVTNYGTISGSFGIEADVSGNVTNAGTITGTAGPAIQFSANPDTLTLLPGSTIIGAIALDGGGDTVNFRGGNHNLTFDTLAGATVTGPAPFVVSGNRAVAIDVTPFALEDRAVMDFSRAVSFALPDIDTAGARKTASAEDGSGSAMAFAGAGTNESLIANDFAAIPGLSTYAEASTLPFKAPTAVYGNGAAVWARGFAGERIQDADGAVLHAHDRFLGGLIGGGGQAWPNLRLGAFLGAGETRSSLDFSYGGVKSTLLFGGLFARYAWGASFLKVTLQGGHSRNDSTRNINNNLVPGGIETAKASFGGWYVDPEATFGHHFALGAYSGALYTLTPSLSVRYLHASFDGYTETGSTANLTIGSRSADDFEEQGQLKLARAQALPSGATLITDVFGGMLAEERAGNKTIDATLLGQAVPFATPGDHNVWGGFIGGGLEWRSGGLALYAQADYLALSDQSSIVSGEAGLRVSF